MSIITYVANPNYPIIQGASVGYNNGQLFDIKAALVGGGGSFGVSDQLYPELINALDSSQAVIRSGVTPGSLVTVNSYGPIYGYKGSNPQEGDVLVRQSDGSWAGDIPNIHVEAAYAETIVTQTLSSVTSADVPGVQIAWTFGSRPVYLEVSGHLQWSKGTGTAGEIGLGALKVVDVSTSAEVLRAGFQAALPASGGVQAAIYGVRRLTGTAGTSQTVKLQLSVLTYPTGAFLNMNANAAFPVSLRAVER